MKPYPRYKPTGLAWLPSVPEHWEATKIRTIFTERTTKVSDKYYPPLSVSKGGVVPQIETVAKSDDSDNRKLVRIGDFVINSRSDRKGSSGVSELDGSVSLVNLVLKPRKKGNGRFLHYLLKSDPFVEEFYRNGHGIVADLWTTRYSEMKSIYIPLPPPSEQDRIVRYLDEKTAAIDELVRAKEREIDLLRERKQALVTAAVTGGAGDLNTEAQRHRGTEGIHSKTSESLSLCDSVLKTGGGVQGFQHRGTESKLADLPEFRDSGIPWIGKIPKHWEVVKFKRIAHVCANLVEPDNYMDCPQIAPECIEKDSGRLIQLRTVRDAGVVSGNHLFTKGQILYSKIRPTLNKVVIAPTDGLCSADMYPIETNQDTNWLVYFMLSSVFVQQVSEFCARVKMPKINKEDLGQLLVFVPPLPEQRRIVAHLDSICADFAAAEAAIRKQIALLQELRTRLVSDVVTGAVEV